MRGSGYTIAYAAGLGLASALLLTAASKALEPYKEANRQAKRMRNVLGVLGVPVPKGASSRDLVSVYQRNVRESRLGELEVYEFAPEGGPARAVAVPFAGMGLWGPVKGLLALDPGLRTIRGIAFYEQEETPGLGAQIAEDDFRGRFVGKRIESPAGAPGMVVAPGAAAEANGVDAISGATLTCQKVQNMLNEVIARIVRERDGRG